MEKTITAPQIVSQLPGPEAKKILEKDEKYISPSYGRPYPLVAEEGRGAFVVDPDGNTFLDFAAGIAVVSTGHCHPKVVKAIQEQAEKLIHISGTDFYYRSQVELAEKLQEIFPGNYPVKSFLTNSGTESIEGSFKLARYKTKRPNMIAFLGAFHGRSLGSVSLTASKNVQRRHFAPLIPGVYHIPYGYCYRCAYKQKYPECDIYCLDYLKKFLFKKLVAPDEVAAVIAEPIQGEGGYVCPPEGYFQKLSQICQEYGILLIIDEVQSGMGRTGKMFAIEHWGVTPDILAIAKGIASGMPLGAFVAKADVMDWPPGTHANTFGGNPIACKAALTTIELLQNELIANAANVGDYLKQGLYALQEKHSLIGDVRGRGLMLGVELVKDRNTKEPAIKESDAVVTKAFHKGLLILGCGESSFRLSPPLVINKSDADIALKILDEVLSEVEKN